MLKIFIYFTFILSSVAMADFNSSTEVLQKLKTYKPTFFSEIHDLETAADMAGNAYKNHDSPAEKKQIEFYQDVIAAIDFVEKQSRWDLKIVNEIFRLSCLSLDNDPSWMIARNLLPLYHKDPKVFILQMRSLPASDAKNLEQAIKNADQESKEGNG